MFLKKVRLRSISFKFYLLTLLLVTGGNTGFSESDNFQIIYSPTAALYNQMHLSHYGLAQDVFEKAFTGWNILVRNECIENPGLVTIADLSQSSNSKRLYVIDMINKKLLFNTYVAHGRNSGEEYAHSFSNRANSFQSSLGFYLTQNTYAGTHGLSMKLRGLEKGINDGAEERGIVMHGAPYVSDTFINQYGRLGRSQGCPAVPEEFCSPIINSIKGGSCLFMFYPDSNYFRNSAIL